MEQRKILFKAKRLGNNKWMEGDLLHDGSMTSICFNAKNGMLITEEVDPSTVCQFTGLKDKSLTPIYEGDIIQNPEWPFEKRIVTWVKHQACYMPMDEEGCQDRDFSFLVLFKEWTVVGNKFDRKEEK